MSRPTSIDIGEGWVCTVLLVTDDSLKMPVLELEGVGVKIDGQRVLNDIDWTIQQGEHWVVLGPNGGGKSTILRIASLQLHPSTGSVTILGHRLGRIDIRPLRARVGISAASMVQQIRATLTANDIVSCGLYGALEPWWHSYSNADHARADDLLSQVGLADYGPRTFATLSSGERQRVMLARTLMPNPELLLLDEPTAGLDFGGREELVGSLRSLARDPEAPASVLVTHRVEDIPETTTHLLAIADGEVAAMGPIQQTLTAELLSRVFALPVQLTKLEGRWSAQATVVAHDRDTSGPRVKTALTSRRLNSVCWR